MLTKTAKRHNLIIINVAPNPLSVRTGTFQTVCGDPAILEKIYSLKTDSIGTYSLVILLLLEMTGPKITFNCVFSPFSTNLKLKFGVSKNF